MEKTCSKCKLTLNESEFNNHGYRKDGSIKRQTYCRACNKIHSKQYYRDNHDYHIQQTGLRKKDSQSRARNLILEYLESHPCVDCGNQEILVLDFDHLRDKTKNISEMVSEGFGVTTIQAEIDKCEIRCRNCHSKKTHRTQNTFRWRYVKKRL